MVFQKTDSLLLKGNLCMCVLPHKACVYILSIPLFSDVSPAWAYVSLLGPKLQKLPLPGRQHSFNGLICLLRDLKSLTCIMISIILGMLC